MIKYFNYALFTILTFIFFSFSINEKISTSLYSILPQGENKELLKEFSKFDSNKKLFIAIKADDDTALEKLKEFEDSIQLKVRGLKKQTLKSSETLKEYEKAYYFYLNKIDKNRLENLNTKEELSKLYQKIIDSFLIVDINKQDPFSIIKEKKTLDLNIKKGQIFLENYGYLSIFNIEKEIDTLNEYEEIYDTIKKLKHQDFIIFSPIFYFVENSRYIKNDASKIIIFATILLLIIYLAILRDIKLLINTFLTLLSSAFIAIIFITFIYKQISIFVLVFGLSSSTIAIDYMFHHYFHKNYEKDFKFNKEVFLGFFTTFFALFILSFVDFLLIKQIALFTIISLFSSYLIFAFIYPKIKFKVKDFQLYSFNHLKIAAKYIFALSIITLFFTLQNLNFDFDIKSLDYDNKELKEKENFFKSKLQKKEKEFLLIKAKSINELIFYNEEVKKIDKSSYSSLDKLISKQTFIKKYKELPKEKLDNLNKEINKEILNTKFKKDTFLDVYNYKIEAPLYTYEKLISYNIDIQKYEDSYLSYTSVSKDKLPELLKKEYLYALNLKTLFSKTLEKDLKKILILGTLSLCFIILVLFIITKRKIVKALCFLSLPSAFIFLYLHNININILHIFMFFIILAISIDYAIYSTKSNLENTKKAILFSALSSFAGFGVLIFSNTISLFSIGIVASLGIIAILILIQFLKVEDAA